MEGLREWHEFYVLLGTAAVGSKISFQPVARIGQSRALPFALVKQLAQA